jgi:hypothetical protein
VSSVLQATFLRLSFAWIYACRYAVYYETFTKMFPIPSNETTVHYLPGNNDVGLNMDPTESQHARRRFAKHFGPLDQTVTIQNHTLVLLDASGVIEEDYRRLRGGPGYESPKGGTMDFVGSLPPGLLIIQSPCREDLKGQTFFLIGNKSHPVVLFTHIPLFRPDSARCGPLRESGTIRRGAGPNYQSTIGKEVSAFLLDHLHPTMVFRSANTSSHTKIVRLTVVQWG